MLLTGLMSIYVVLDLHVYNYIIHSILYLRRRGSPLKYMEMAHNGRGQEFILNLSHYFSLNVTSNAIYVISL